ncbi:MAG: hypothetical protein RLZZ454_170 [Pseudomonadota bacterium]
MVNVANRAYVNVGLGSCEFFFSHKFSPKELVPVCDLTSARYCLFTSHGHEAAYRRRQLKLLSA